MIPSSLSLIFLAAAAPAFLTNTSALLPDDPVLLVLDLSGGCRSCLPPLFQTKLGSFLLASSGSLHFGSCLRWRCSCSCSHLGKEFLQGSNSLFGDTDGKDLKGLSSSCFSSCLFALGASHLHPCLHASIATNLQAKVLTSLGSSNSSNLCSFLTSNL